ncbi:hypothetical protein QJS66_17385 [Kocuria rhizophila]|nr:hypothetical protein QJS66_17385 [Kocuria rhizophila]
MVLPADDDAGARPGRPGAARRGGGRGGGAAASSCSCAVPEPAEDADGVGAPAVPTR